MTLQPTRLPAARFLAASVILTFWSPFDAAYYAVGPFWLLVACFRNQGRLRAPNAEAKSYLIWNAAFAAAFAAAACLGFWNLNNLAWSAASYGSTLAVGLASLGFRWTREDVRWSLNFLLVTTLVQIPIGYFQMLRGHGFSSLNPFSLNMGAGDYFAGTTFDRYNSTSVALKMATPFFLAYPFWAKAKNATRTVLMGLLALGWMLPSVMHSLLVGVAAFLGKAALEAAPNLLRMRISRRLFAILLLVTGVFAGTYWLQRDNIRYVVQIGQKVVGSEELAPRKIKFLRKVFGDFLPENPWRWLVGCGPGNFSSRGASLVSGEFKSRQPGYIPVTPSPEAQRYVIPYWNRQILKRPFSDGVANMPFSTWVSIFGEMGLLGLACFLMGSAALVRRVRRLAGSDDDFLKPLAEGTGVLLWFCAGLFLLDNWFEYPAFMGVVLLFAGALLALPDPVSAPAAYQAAPKASNA